MHGISENGDVIFNKPIKRAKLLAFFQTLPPCTVGMEACGSSHHWGRQLHKLGHDVKLMPAGYVKPYVKRGKSDAVDAEAICEAVRRPTMRFVEIKTEDQQAILSIHRTRDLAVRQRTQLANMIRSLLREFGHILPIGIEAVTAFSNRHLDGDHPDMPEIANGMLGIQCYQFIGLNERISGYSKMIEQHAMRNADARRLGPVDILGMTSRAVMAKRSPEKVDLWTAKIVADKPFRLATVAMANKAARAVWAMLTKKQEYRQPAF